MQEELDPRIVQSLWERGILTHLMWPQQLDIFNHIYSHGMDAETVVLLCARQYGKSFLVCLMAVMDCLQNPNVTVQIIGPTYDQTREIVAPRIDYIKRYAPPGLIRRIKSEKRWLIGTSDLILGGFDTGSGKTRGKTLYRVYIEEVVDANPDDYIDKMRSDIGPALTHSILGQMVFATTLPKIPDHPFITETMPEARLSNTYYEFTIDDNKALSKEKYDKAIKRAGGRNSLEARRELFCEIVRDPTVLLAPDFDEKKATTGYAKPNVANWQIVLDFGGTKDHTHVLWRTYSYLDNKDIYDGELSFGPNTNTSRIVEQVINKSNYEYGGFDNLPFYVDGPGQIRVDMREEMNITTRPVPKADWLGSVNNVNLGFYHNRIKINKEGCPVLIETCRSGTFNKQRNDFARTKALGHMDAFAALSYGQKVSDKRNPYNKSQNERSDNYQAVRRREDPMQKVARAINNPVGNTNLNKRFGKFK